MCGRKWLSMLNYFCSISLCFKGVNGVKSYVEKNINVPKTLILMTEVSDLGPFTTKLINRTRGKTTRFST